MRMLELIILILPLLAIVANICGVAELVKIARAKGHYTNGAGILWFIGLFGTALMVGLIVCAQTGTGTTNAGLSYETFAVAASVIGGISTMGGTGILSGVLVGASVWAVMDNGLQLIGTQVGLKNVIVGLIVIVCVLLDVIRRTGSFKKKPA